MPDTPTTFIAGMPEGYPATPLPGSVQRPCSKCQRKAWFSPTSQRIMARGAIPVCLYCVPRDAEVGITPEQIQEIRLHRKRN